MELAKRKNIRLTDYDYSTPGAYFITVCTYNRNNLFWAHNRNVIESPADVLLTDFGRAVDLSIRNIPAHYPMVLVDHYVIMPNHVHLLLQIQDPATIDDPEARRRGGDPPPEKPSQQPGPDCSPRSVLTISRIVNQFKGAASKNVGFPIWQKGFYDHVIRCDADYREIWKYIDGNPVRWQEDSLYTESSK